MMQSRAHWNLPCVLLFLFFTFYAILLAKGYEGYMDINGKNRQPRGKGAVIFGAINLLLVILCSWLKVFILSTAMIILLILGICVSVQGIKEAKAIAQKKQLAVDIAGLLINCAALLLYAFTFVTRLLNMILRFF